MGLSPAYGAPFLGSRGAGPPCVVESLLLPLVEFLESIEPPEDLVAFSSLVLRLSMHPLLPPSRLLALLRRLILTANSTDPNRRWRAGLCILSVARQVRRYIYTPFLIGVGPTEGPPPPPFPPIFYLEAPLPVEAPSFYLRGEGREGDKPAQALSVCLSCILCLIPLFLLLLMLLLLLVLLLLLQLLLTHGGCAEVREGLAALLKTLAGGGSGDFDLRERAAIMIQILTHASPKALSKQTSFSFSTSFFFRCCCCCCCCPSLGGLKSWGSSERVVEGMPSLLSMGDLFVLCDVYFRDSADINWGGCGSLN